MFQATDVEAERELARGLRAAREADGHVPDNRAIQYGRRGHNVLHGAQRPTAKGKPLRAFLRVDGGLTVYVFATTCVNSTAEKIDALVYSARAIKYRAFRAALGGDELDDWASAMLYDTGNNRGGLRLCNDPCVGYFRGVYDSRRALFIDHSAIEHIWVQQ